MCIRDRAYRVKKNSDRKVHQLKRKGFNNANVVGKNHYGLYQVVFDSYKTRDEAQNELAKIKRLQNSSAWILFKPLN